MSCQTALTVIKERVQRLTLFSVPQRRSPVSEESIGDNATPRCDTDTAWHQHMWPIKQEQTNKFFIRNEGTDSRKRKEIYHLHLVFDTCMSQQRYNKLEQLDVWYKQHWQGQGYMLA